jgi:hypothetical protein
VLLIQDTTWLDYSAHPSNRGMGRHGGNKAAGRGLFLHSVLGVEPVGVGSSMAGHVVGLAWGKVWARTGPAPSAKRKQRHRSIRRRSPDRESLRWIEAVEQIGSAPADGPRWIHVGDRESDIYDLYDRIHSMTGVGFVVRLRHARNAVAGHDTPDTATIKQRRSTDLKKICRDMPAVGHKRVWIAPRPGVAGRWADLSVSGGPVTLWSPQLNRTGRALRCWAVRVWEAAPPEGQTPVEWMLVTSEKLETVADILRIAEYYTLRWLIEQYHQCLKSGCKVERRQLESADRLGPLIGMLCPVAARLLQLKNDVRLDPDRLARRCVEEGMVQTLGRLIGIDTTALSLRRFTHEVAKLGGFIGRKGDGEPGWRTLWQGWHELSLIHAGYQLSQAQMRYG